MFAYHIPDFGFDDIIDFGEKAVNGWKLIMDAVIKIPKRERVVNIFHKLSENKKK